MIGPMKKKVIVSAVVTAIVLIVIFSVVSVVFISENNKKIAILEERGEVVQRYVFAKDMVAGDIVTSEDIKYVDVKGESAPIDSYQYKEDTINGEKVVTINEMYSIIGRRLKVNANEKTIVTASLFYEKDKEPAIDTRLQEFNMITLPSDLKVGDYIDVRLRFPTGEDFSVLIAKKIESFGALKSESNTIFLRLSEEEIVRMGSAIIESYIRDGVNLYANKYVDPSTQLYEYKSVDYVAKFEEARYLPASDLASGESTSGNSVSIELVERPIEEIASLIALSVEETKDIKNALAGKNEDILKLYKNKLITMEKSIVATYPVKAEVATLIHNNPNILEEVKAKYDIAKLEAERINLLDTELTKVDELTGEIVENEDRISAIQEKLNKEIEIQKSERQEYLLNLLANQNTSAN